MVEFNGVSSVLKLKDKKNISSVFLALFYKFILLVFETRIVSVTQDGVLWHRQALTYCSPPSSVS